MREAEYYLDGYKSHMEYPNYYHESQIVEMINRARIEAIRECAENAKITYNLQYNNKSGIHDPVIVDRQSILKLIEQVK